MKQKSGRKNYQSDIMQTEKHKKNLDNEHDIMRHHLLKVKLQRGHVCKDPIFAKTAHLRKHTIFAKTSSPQRHHLCKMFVEVNYKRQRKRKRGKGEGKREKEKEKRKKRREGKEGKVNTT